MSDLLELVSLQAVDDDLDEARARLATIEELLGPDVKLEEARERHAGAHTRLAGLQQRHRALEGRMQDLGAHIEREEKKLYDGSVKQFKELQALESEVEHLRRERSSLEDDGLQLLAELEESATTLKGLDDELDALARDWEERSADLRVEAGTVKARINAREADRTIVLDRVTTGAHRLYEGLRRRKGGKAVVRIQGSSCTGCRVSVPDAVRRRIVNSPTLVQCPQCERILAPG